MMSGETQRKERKLGIKQVVLVQRKTVQGCPSATTSSCGVAYRGS